MSMTAERTQAYGRVMKTLQDVGPAKLQPSEQARVRRALPVLLAAGLTACGGHHAPPVRTAPVPAPRLTDAHACRFAPGATCATLRVPLDPAGRTRGALDLRVAMSGRRGAPVLV